MESLGGFIGGNEMMHSLQTLLVEKSFEVKFNQTRI